MPLRDMESANEMCRSAPGLKERAEIDSWDDNNISP
jgi:hypothetical protein